MPEVTLSGQAAPINGDPAQLGAVIKNLVQNAQLHGGDGVTVRVHAWTEAERTGFDVVDDGVGISAANLPRVFDRFFTTDRAGGTGLGLALVRAIVEQHGGDVDVTSRPRLHHVPGGAPASVLTSLRGKSLARPRAKAAGDVDEVRVACALKQSGCGHAAAARLAAP